MRSSFVLLPILALSLSGCCSLAYGPSQCAQQDMQSQAAASTPMAAETVSQVAPSAAPLPPEIVPAPRRPVVQAPFMASPSIEGNSKTLEKPATKDKQDSWLKL